ncbi:hypothetical protein HX109_09905 [Galbibacter sp. BG1]|uniref:hypothetical protein n=1 Tax=Galbibacter sp. BG1 TaxID=1170699 RepID=UPI0015C159B9|nr:hypothetical protein [Galbibacter sp. BG1]QLE01853.1 hypothetical protein HX109_09905 [Galbibacter sp. BG1]
MKSIWRNALMILIPATTLIVSCNDDSNNDVNNPQTEALSPQEVKTTMEATQLSEDIDNIVNVVSGSGLEEGGTASKSTLAAKGWLPECLTVTTQSTSDSFMATLDFGEGCEMPDGKMLAGKLMMSTANNADSTSFMNNSEVTFENFMVDTVTVNGTKSFENVFEEGQDPKSMVNTDVTFAYQDETTLDYSSEQTRVWVEGYDTQEWLKSAFEITGTASLTTRDGVTYNAEATTPLRAELFCSYLVSGVLRITSEDAMADLDYGDGECDDKATVTGPNGNSVEIVLEK